MGLLRGSVSARPGGTPMFSTKHRSINRAARIVTVFLAAGALTISSIAESFAQRGGFGGGRAMGGGMNSPGGGRFPGGDGPRNPGGDGPRYPGGGGGPRFPGGGGGIIVPGGYGGPGRGVIRDGTGRAHERGRTAKRTRG